jgi:biopolymer transport protein ExbD
MSLPSQAPSDTPPDIAPMLIEILDNGSILVNKEEALDTVASGRERELPLLVQRLLIYKDGATAANTEPLVQVAVRAEASQQSVIDVLNCLVGLEIQKVTFTDFSND